jgi:hypothetical protein
MLLLGSFANQERVGAAREASGVRMIGPMPCPNWDCIGLARNNPEIPPLKRPPILGVLLDLGQGTRVLRSSTPWKMRIQTNILTSQFSATVDKLAEMLSHLD